MPLQKKKYSKPASKRAAPKRTYKKRGAISKPKGSRMSGPLKNYVRADPFRPNMSCRLHYSEVYTFTTGAVGVCGTEQVVRLNSLFDPDFTGVGHQPFGFDQMALLYRRYKVNAVLIKLTWSDPTADGMFAAVTIQPPGEPASLTGATSQAVAEQPMSTVKVLNATGSQKAYIKQFVPISTISGVTPLQFKSDVTNFQALTTANPALTPWLRFSAGSDRGTAGVTLQCRMDLTYYCQFWDRITFFGS